MSNLNDFIGGTRLKFWRNDGISANSSHGSYDIDSRVEILGTTTDTHYFGREFKLHHIPDRRIFYYTSSSDSIDLKINLSASTTSAPNPSESVTHTDNLTPTLQAFARCLSYKIYTKQNLSDSYTLKGQVDPSAITFSALGDNVAVNSSDTDVNARINFNITYSGSSASKTWQGASSTQAQFARLFTYISMNPNLDEAWLIAPNEGQLFVKIRWELDNTAYNNLFSRTYNEVEGVHFQNFNATVMSALYSGERQYTASLQSGRTISN